MFFALQVDRGNLSQAVSDNMLNQLGLSTNGNLFSDPEISLFPLLALIMKLMLIEFNYGKSTLGIRSLCTRKKKREQ
jgi:hypothetical protein